MGEELFCSKIKLFPFAGFFPNLPQLINVKKLQYYHSKL